MKVILRDKKPLRTMMGCKISSTGKLTVWKLRSASLRRSFLAQSRNSRPEIPPRHPRHAPHDRERRRPRLNQLLLFARSHPWTGWEASGSPRRSCLRKRLLPPAPGAPARWQGGAGWNATPELRPASISGLRLCQERLIRPKQARVQPPYPLSRQSRGRTQVSMAVPDDQKLILAPT